MTGEFQFGRGDSGGLGSATHIHRASDRAFRYYAFLCFMTFFTLLDPFIGSIRYPSKLEWLMEQFDNQTMTFNC
jgi:hypothetical protein